MLDAEVLLHIAELLVGEGPEPGTETNNFT